MARRPRNDAPDTWHHVMNRAIARRTLFETKQDYRKFLALLAIEVRRGLIEVHAYSLLQTHFHLLLRSVKGDLSAVMRRVQNGYARWFNRSRHRDGPLFRGRFRSWDIDTLEYRRNVVTYIHDNSVDAGLASDPILHSWSSARHFAGERRPTWFATDWVGDEMSRRGQGDSQAERLMSAFPSRIEEGFRAWVEKQLQMRNPEESEDASLRHAGSPRVLRWMMRKAELADGTMPFRPVSPANIVERVIGSAKRRLGSLTGLFAMRMKDVWVALKAGLLRLLSGCKHREIGLRAGRHTSTCCRDVQDHLQLLRTVPEYELLAAELGARVLALGRKA